MCVHARACVPERARVTKIFQNNSNVGVLILFSKTSLPTEPDTQTPHRYEIFMGTVCS